MTSEGQSKAPEQMSAGELRIYCLEMAHRHGHSGKAAVSVAADYLGFIAPNRAGQRPVTWRTVSGDAATGWMSA